MSIAQRLPDYSKPGVKDPEYQARTYYSCPDCGAAKGVWCRKIPGSKDKIVYYGRWWGQRRRTQCHDSRHAKRILCEGV